jgi:hypothetical protein
MSRRLTIGDVKRDPSTIETSIERHLQTLRDRKTENAYYAHLVHIREHGTAAPGYGAVCTAMEGVKVRTSERVTLHRTRSQGVVSARRSTISLGAYE